MVASGALYVASILCFAPSYFQMMQTAAVVYGAYDQPIPFPWQQATVVLVVVALLRGRDLRSPLAAWAVIATLGSLAAASAAAVQGKNYDYHYVPAQVLSGSALVFAAAGRLRERATSPRARARLGTSLLAAALAMALVWTGANLRAIREKTRHDNRLRAASVLRHLAGGGPILVFTSSVFPIFPILSFTGLRSTSPYSMMWPIAGNYALGTRSAASGFPYRPLAQHSAIERAFIDRIVEGMREAPPTLLLFDDARYKQAFGELAFDFERYFRADPRFVELMRGYERRDPLFDRYELWLRADRAETPAQ